jgi:outer membrane biosynthesis protein TonB
MDAVRWWRYEPYVVNGQPVTVQTTVAVNFRLAK